jgi:hypothetical protein
VEEQDEKDGDEGSKLIATVCWSSLRLVTTSTAGRIAVTGVAAPKLCVLAGWGALQGPCTTGLPSMGWETDPGPP